MRTNDAGLALIKQAEGLELKAYPDPASELGRACTAKGYSMRNYGKIKGWRDLSGGPWTIGYGDTGPDVVEGLAITQGEAEDRLRSRLEREFEPEVLQALGGAAVSQNQFSALVSLAYNIGVAALKSSTVLRCTRAGAVKAASQAFGLWNKAGGKALPGLTRRRDAESALYLTPESTCKN